MERKDFVDMVKGKATELKLAGTTAVMVALPTVTAFAAEPAAGSNMLDSETMAVITNAFSSLAITATAVVGIAVTTAVGVVGLTTGAKFALKKVKGVLSSAA